MARRKRKDDGTVVAGLPVIRRQDDVLEPVYEADPDGRPVVHHRTVDTLGIMLRAGTITREMHDAARDFQAQFTVARFDVVRCMPLMRLPGGGGAEISPTLRSMPAVVSAQHSTRSAAWAAPPVRASGTSSVCSARSASGRCGRAGAARPVRIEQAQGILVAALGMLAGYYGYARRSLREAQGKRWAISSRP